MKCTMCGSDMKIIDVRAVTQDTEKLRRRRYECSFCGFRMSVVEIEETIFDRYRKRAIDAETSLYALKKKIREVVA